ncbi:MAG: SPOR domain-containing protein, partial [Ilumatobacteraceae bacterium]|nr:SPOR domain-containing protein [Ilumatobacteraceae bacterium]
MPKSKVLFASALALVVVLSACSAAKSTEPTTTFGTVASPVRTLPTLPADAATPSQTTPGETTPLNPVLAAVDTSTTMPTTVPTSSSTPSSTTTDWEVVGGIFTTKAAAQTQIDKLTAAKFTGFSLKAVGAKTAAVLPGLTKADATAMAAKINTAGMANATTFHLTSATTTDWEVVGGIFTTKAAAQSQIDKLTAAKFTGFSLKAVGAKTAAVLPGLTKADATALAAKINTAGVATATTFHL